ncbi:hypothetical protein M8C21_031524 [Ambrosia artemisiifolia]|uniref:RRM domain-containing protein n=1 Tax=Ambrosia artemisiifolia TaxID=4212 RepID=A0AAD5CU02_AMBAR|nr:hypothetical protein M8C21_031524 [Ambrosia artemisiifolia]
MSHFGRAGPPDIRDTYSLLVLNITFRTTADDLFPLFDKYGKVVDVFIPRDRRTGDSRGFAFVRYKYADEAQKAFAKYGPDAERIHKGRIVEPVDKLKGRSRSRSPRPRSVSPPARGSVSPRKSPSPRRTPSRSRSPAARDEKERSPTPKSVSPRGRSASRSPSPQRSDADLLYAVGENRCSLQQPLSCWVDVFSWWLNPILRL